MEASRKYSPVWKKIKEDGFVEISAHKAYHRRIIKAIAKEKDLDLLFKMESLERIPPIRTIVYSKSVGSVIRFNIVEYPLITVDTI